LQSQIAFIRCKLTRYFDVKLDEFNHGMKLLLNLINQIAKYSTSKFG